MNTEKERYPKHIGIILDGNRRWAKDQGKMTWQGHKAGFDKVGSLFEWIIELGIKEMSMYCFSMQNFNRSKIELEFLMKLFEKAAKDVITDERVHKNKVKIRFIGRLELLPENVQKAVAEAMEATKDYDGYTVNFCMAYGGREEIVDGVNKAITDAKAGKIEKVDEKSFGKYLYIQSDPDIIIRTSGEHRISNFLLWHLNYSEFFFLEKHWPAFEKEDLIKVIDEFVKTRQRRFGS